MLESDEKTLKVDSDENNYCSKLITKKIPKLDSEEKSRKLESEL